MDQTKNFLKCRLSRIQWTFVHNNLKYMGHNEKVAQWNDNSTKYLLKKLKKSHIGRLATHLKAQLQKQQQNV